MAFKIKNKVAIVTGGASGIGLSLVKELLKNGAKGVILADIDVKSGTKIAVELNEEFGANKVKFVRTDVSDRKSFENAFKVTLDNFKNIDILCNNAAIINEVDWERTVDINLKGNIIGIRLALENYIKNHKQEEEGLILNTASVAAIVPGAPMQTYSATKFGILGLTKAWGHEFHYESSKVRVAVILPGMTNTPIYTQVAKGSDVLRPEDKKFAVSMVESLQADMHNLQSPDFVAEEAMKVIEKASNGSAWIIESSKPAYEYIIPDFRTCEKNIF